MGDLWNSPSVWAAAAFGYGRWLCRRPAAAVGAAIVLVVGVEAYYLTDVLVRDADRANLTSVTAWTWIGAGVVAGVVFGLAGSWAAERSGWRAVLGRAALPAVLGAEAVRAVVRITREPADARPDDLGQFAVLLGALALVTLVASVRRVDRRTAVQVVAASALAALVVGGAAGLLV